MTYVKINGILYSAKINGNTKDINWDGRMNKSITLEMSISDAVSLFTDGLVWSIVMDITQEDGTTSQQEYDNSDYCLAGDITDHRDGTITAKMGKYTDLELALLAIAQEV